jgi:hypothetical protein
MARHALGDGGAEIRDALDARERGAVLVETVCVQTHAAHAHGFELHLGLPLCSSFGRCSPVATRTVIRALGTPPSRSARIIAGRKRPFGTGRVMSQTRMQAERVPRASSRRGGHPTGTASACSTAARGAAIASFWITVGTQPAGGETVTVPRP